MIEILMSIALDVRAMDPHSLFIIQPDEKSIRLSALHDPNTNVCIYIDDSHFYIKIKCLIVQVEELSNPNSIDNMKKSLFNFFNYGII